MTGILAGQPFESTIKGDASIANRPMRRISDPLSLMGAKISGKEKNKNVYPPLTIDPVQTLTPVKYTLPMASAQVKSAILFASLYSQHVTQVIEPVACRDHTERVMEAYGVDIKRVGKTIHCSGRNVLNNPFNKKIEIPKDISSAMFFVALAVIRKNTKLTMTGIGLNPTRRACLDVLIMMGADIKITEKQSQLEPIADIVASSSELKNIDVPVDLIPSLIDEIPILAICSLFAKGVCRVRSAKELRYKETDRIMAIKEMVESMGGVCKEYEDGFDIEGINGAISSFKLNAYHDHRIAMSAIIGAFAANSTGEVSDIDCINTSFPNFLASCEGLGLNYSLG